jgi:hypothetical protein
MFLKAIVIGWSSWLAAGALVAEEVELRARYAPDAHYRLRLLSKSSQVYRPGGIDLSVTAEVTSHELVTHGPLDDQGAVQVEQQNESIVADIELQGMKVHFDSADPQVKAGNPIAEVLLGIFKAQSHLTLKYLVSADGKIGDVAGVVEGSFLSPSDLQHEYQQNLDRWPVKAVVPGAVWEVDEVMYMGQGQLLRLHRRYEYQGSVPKFPTVSDSKPIDKIVFTTTSVEYDIEPGAGFPFKIAKNEVKVLQGEGSLLFDRELGRVVESTDMIHAGGELVLTLDGAEYGDTLDLTIERSSKEIDE